MDGAIALHERTAEIIEMHFRPISTEKRPNAFAQTRLLATPSQRTACATNGRFGPLGDFGRRDAAYAGLTTSPFPRVVSASGLASPGRGELTRGPGQRDNDRMSGLPPETASGCTPRRPARNFPKNVARWRFRVESLIGAGDGRRGNNLCYGTAREIRRSQTSAPACHRRRTTLGRRGLQKPLCIASPVLYG